MNDDTKRKALVWLGLVMALVIIVAASLSQLDLQPGMPFPKLDGNQEIVLAPVVETEPSRSIPLNRFLIIFIAIFATGTVLYALYRLLRGAVWKEIWAFIWPMVTSSLLVSGFLYVLFSLPNTGNLVSAPLPVPTPEPIPTSPLGSVPPILFWLVGLGLLVAAILAAIWIFGLGAKRTRTMDAVGVEAEKARQALKTGLDLKNVIIRCYQQMSLALAEDQGIEREEFITIREFEALLVAAGMPLQPVHQLTQLFEAVRYGNWQPDPVDEQKAIHCLDAIVLHSRQAKESN
jgi:hypothetical protein